MILWQDAGAGTKESLRSRITSWADGLRLYGYRALREITDETLPDDARHWREWYAAKGAETTQKFRQLDPDKPQQ